MSAASLSLHAKLAITAVAVGGTAAVAGLGTFGAFTSTTEAGTGVSTGTVAIALGEAGTSANRLTVGASGLVPGDTLQRAVQLSNTGSVALSTLSLTTAASTSSVLDTDAAGGLQLTVDRCPVAWTETSTTPYTYACAGTVTPVVASRPVLGAAVALDGAALTPGTTDHLRVTLQLPSAAGNAFQGQSSTLVLAFTGAQRTATNQ